MRGLLLFSGTYTQRSKIISPCIANRKILRQDKFMLFKSNIKKDEDINMSWHLVNESVSAEQTKISHTT